jgi:hypothetical protein
MPYFYPGSSTVLTVNTGLGNFSTLSTTGPTEPEGFTADPVDAPDGLTRQFRLSPKFGPMPPRTMEGMDLFFQLNRPRCNSVYRLRFHTASAYFDFPFRLVIEQSSSERL